MTYNSLLNPFVMRVEQRPAEIHCELRWVNEYVKLFDLCANYHFEAELVFEELRADFGDCLLKETGGS